MEEFKSVQIIPNPGGPNTRIRIRIFQYLKICYPVARYSICQHFIFYYHKNIQVGSGICIDPYTLLFCLPDPDPDFRTMDPRIQNKFKDSQHWIVY
jgi:hypothetical protein